MFKTGDRVSYSNHPGISECTVITGILLGVASESGPVRTWIMQFEDPGAIQTKNGIWRGAVVPECILERVIYDG